MGDGNGDGISKADEIDQLLYRVLQLVKGQKSNITAHLIEMAILNQRRLNSGCRQTGCPD